MRLGPDFDHVLTADVEDNAAKLFAYVEAHRAAGDIETPTDRCVWCNPTDDTFPQFKPEDIIE